MNAAGHERSKRVSGMHRVARGKRLAVVRAAVLANAECDDVVAGGSVGELRNGERARALVERNAVLHVTSVAAHGHVGVRIAAPVAGHIREHNLHRMRHWLVHLGSHAILVTRVVNCQAAWVSRSKPSCNSHATQLWRGSVASPAAAAQIRSCWITDRCHERV